MPRWRRWDAGEGALPSFGGLLVDVARELLGELAGKYTRKELS